MPLEKNKTAEATLKIPFDSHLLAEIAYRVLSVDQEPKRNFVSKNLRLVDDCIEVHFTAEQVKNLRTAITSFFENLLLCKDTINSFDLSAAKDAGTHSGTNAT